MDAPTSQLVLAATIAAGLGAGVLVAAAALRALRRAARDRALIVAVAVAVVVIGVGAFYTSLLKVSAWTGTWVPIAVLDGSIFVFTAVELAQNAKGKSLPVMNRLQWCLLLVTVAANAYGEEPVAAALHGSMPLIWKGAVIGLKALILEKAVVTLSDRIPLSRWLDDPRGTWWIRRQLSLGRVPDLTAALALDTQVAVNGVRRRQEAAEAGTLGWLRRGPSARDLALLDALTAPEPKRRAKPAPTKTTVPTMESASADAPLDGDGELTAATAFRPAAWAGPPAPADQPETELDEKVLTELRSRLDEAGRRPSKGSVKDVAGLSPVLPARASNTALAYANELNRRAAAEAAS